MVVTILATWLCACTVAALAQWWERSLTRCHMRVQFFCWLSSCSERFFSGFSGFPLSTKTNSAKFQDASYVRFAQDNSPFTKEKRDLEGQKRQGPVIMSSEDYRWNQWRDMDDLAIDLLWMQALLTSTESTCLFAVNYHVLIVVAIVTTVTPASPIATITVLPGLATFWNG